MKLIDALRREFPAKPNAAEGVGIAEHDRAMGSLGADLEKVRDEFGAFAEVNAAETGNARTAMGVDMKKRNALFKGPGHRLVHGVRPHHGADGGVVEIVFVRNQRIGMDKDRAASAMKR